MNTYTFEEMSERYLQDVLDIYNYYVQNTTATFHTKPLDLTEMRALVLFDEPVYKTFLIRCEGQICGYVLVTSYSKRQAYAHTAEVTIYLKPEWSGKGAGSEALRHIEDYARQKGFHVLLALICGENDKSIRLFSKNGYFKCAHYKEVGKKFGRLLDIVAYQKIL